MRMMMSMVRVLLDAENVEDVDDAADVDDVDAADAADAANDGPAADDECDGD